MLHETDITRGNMIMLLPPTTFSVYYMLNKEKHEGQGEPGCKCTAQIGPCLLDSVQWIGDYIIFLDVLMGKRLYDHYFKLMNNCVRKYLDG